MTNIKTVLFLINIAFILPLNAQVTGGGNSAGGSSESNTKERSNNVFNLDVIWLNPVSRFGNKDPFSGVDALGVGSGFGIGLGHEFVRGFYNENYSKIKIGFKQRLEASFHTSEFESNEPGFQSEKTAILNIDYRLGICSRYYINSNSRVGVFILGGLSFLSFSDDLYFTTQDYYFSRSLEDDILNFSLEFGVDFSYKKYFAGISYISQNGNYILFENISGINSSFYNSNEYQVPLSFNFFKVFLGLYF